MKTSKTRGVPVATQCNQVQPSKNPFKSSQIQRDVLWRKINFQIIQLHRGRCVIHQAGQGRSSSSYRPIIGRSDDAGGWGGGAKGGGPEAPGAASDNDVLSNSLHRRRWNAPRGMRVPRRYLVYRGSRTRFYGYFSLHISPDWLRCLFGIVSELFVLFWERKVGSVSCGFTEFSGRKWARTRSKMFEPWDLLKWLVSLICFLKESVQSLEYGVYIHSF